MDLFELQAILSVYQCRNYNDAAYQLSISTSSLSKTITKAEEELGVPLFIRATKSRPVELTEAGVKLLPSIKTIITAWQELQRQAQSLANDETTDFHVGYLPSIGSFGDAKLFSSFIMDNPGIHLQLHPGRPDKLLDMLYAGTVDCLIVPLSEWDLSQDSALAAKLFSPSLVAQELRTSQNLILGINRRSPLAKMEKLTRKDYPMLSGKTILLNNRSSYSLHMDKIRQQLSLPNDSDLDFRVMDFDRSGTVYTMLIDNPNAIAPTVGFPVKRKHEWVFVPVEDWNVKTHLYFIYSRSNKSRALRAFRHAVTDFTDIVEGPGFQLGLMDIGK